MKIYLAGNITVPREKTLMGYQADRLYTFYYSCIGGEFQDEFKYRLEQIKKERIDER
jgi:hypothetical protein